MKYLIIFIFTALLYSCDNIFNIHPYDVNLDGATYINKQNIALIESRCNGKDALRIAFISDTHGWYSDTKDMVNRINQIKDLDFVIHLGDLTDCGTTKEYIWSRDILNKLEAPCISLIGNHDFLGTGDQTFKKMWGNFDFSFIAGNIKLICLNTNATEYDYLAAVPNLQFIEEEIHSDTDLFNRTIVCMHARPYSEQFNNNVAKIFQLYIKNLPGIMFCVNGHDHCIKEESIYGDNIIYYSIDSAEHRSFHLFTINNDGYKYEVVNF